MADESQMNFYEFGRFQYGAARFIFTIENFRQTGKVLAKISTRVNADIRVAAPREGSFIQDILFVAAPVIAECAIQCSFEAIFAYVWDTILPTSKGKDLALALSIEETKREKERTAQEAERTKQISLMAEVANNNNATTQQALDILKDVLEQNKTIHTPAAVLHPSDIKKIVQELEAEKEREELIQKNSTALAKIPKKLENKIASQVRNAFKDIARPLKGSAHDIQILGAPSSRATPKIIANIDATTAKQVTGEIEDDKPTVVRGSIKSFDREACNGKLRYDELQKPINFRIPAEERDHLYQKVIDAMNEDVEDVWLYMYLIRDAYRTPTRAILQNILSDEDYESSSARA